MAITLKEIRRRGTEKPYLYTDVYRQISYVNGKKLERLLTYYDVTNTFREDVLAHLEQYPEILREWVTRRIDTAAQPMTNDAICNFIDSSVFYLTGVFAE